MKKNDTVIINSTQKQMLTPSNTIKSNKKENINMNMNSQDSNHKKPFVRKPSTTLLLNHSRNKGSDSPPKIDKQSNNTQSAVRIVKNEVRFLPTQSHQVLPESENHLSFDELSSVQYSSQIMSSSLFSLQNNVNPCEDISIVKGLCDNLKNRNQRSQNAILPIQMLLLNDTINDQENQGRDDKINEALRKETKSKEKSVKSRNSKSKKTIYQGQQPTTIIINYPKLVTPRNQASFEKSTSNNLHILSTQISELHSSKSSVSLIQKNSQKSKSNQSKKSFKYNKINGNLLKADVSCLDLNFDHSQDEDYDNFNQNQVTNNNSLNKNGLNSKNNNMRKSSSELNLFNKIREGIIGSTISNKPKNLNNVHIQNNSNSINNDNDKVSHQTHIKQIKSFQIKIQKLQKVIMNKDNEIQRLNEKIISQEKKNIELEKKIKVMEKTETNQKISKLQQMLNKSENQCKKFREDYAKTLQELKTKRTENQELKKFENMYNELQRKFELLLSERSDLKQKIHEKTSNFKNSNKKESSLCGSSSSNSYISYPSALSRAKSKSSFRNSQCSYIETSEFQENAQCSVLNSVNNSSSYYMGICRSPNNFKRKTEPFNSPAISKELQAFRISCEKNNGKGLKL